MKITDSQLKTLNSLVCERLSHNDDNLRKVDDFKNSKNDSLVETLQGCAFEDDIKGDYAFYVIKSATGMILAYFSLKCGLLFDKIGDFEILDSKKKLLHLIEKRKLLIDNPEDSDRLKSSLDAEITRLKRELKQWAEIEEQDSIHKRVAKTHSGIELCHFCINEFALDYWEGLGFGDNIRMGTCIFWFFIAPIVIETQTRVGARYLYLFAADATAEEILINHYRQQMNFSVEKEVFATLPVYDFGCRLLSQEINELKRNRDLYFETFNAESDAV